jgi:O-acetyl-ADP-ribose deacetylase (regulator of RNase III)
MQVRIVEGDLLDQPTEGIVNAWNRNIIPWWLLLPQGVSGAIKKRGGLGPFFEIGRAGPIPLGEARVTSAGRLPHKAIIHVAGINMLWRASARSIQDAVRNALAAAEALGLRSLAFPVIGAGSGSFPAAEAERLMREAFAALESPVEVVLVRYQKAPRTSA